MFTTTIVTCYNEIVPSCYVDVNNNFCERGREMNNLRIRQAIAQGRIKYWEIAEALGISDSAFSRKLRKELPDEEQERILAIIMRIKEGAAS